VIGVWKDGQHDACHDKDADGYGDNDGYRSVDGEKECHEAGRKQEY